MVVHIEIDKGYQWLKYQIGDNRFSGSSIRLETRDSGSLPNAVNTLIAKFPKNTSYQISNLQEWQKEQFTPYELVQQAGRNYELKEAMLEAKVNLINEEISDIISENNVA